MMNAGNAWQEELETWALLIQCYTYVKPMLSIALVVKAMALNDRCTLNTLISYLFKSKSKAHAIEREFNGFTLNMETREKQV